MSYLSFKVCAFDVPQGCSSPNHIGTILTNIIRAVVCHLPIILLAERFESVLEVGPQMFTAVSVVEGVL